VAATSLVSVWGLSLVASDLLPTFDVPRWAILGIILLLVMGLPVAMILAWVFEITPKGVVRDAGGPEAPPVGAGVALRAAATPSESADTVIAGGVSVAWHDRSGAHTRHFNRTFTIGRETSCELQLDDPMVSRQHARVHALGGGWRIEDLGSRNGTRVDGALITTLELHRGAVELVLYPGAAPVIIDQQGFGDATLLASESGAAAP
ncbi:MAG: FHA domain-containing protein, partial [Gammaproteobacteria bacterium]